MGWRAVPLCLLFMTWACAPRGLGLAGAVGEEWAQQGGDSAGVACLADGPDPPLKQVWHAEIGRAPVGSAVLTDSVILQGSTKFELIALARSTGQRVGSHRYDSALLGAPVIWDHLVVVALLEPGGGLKAVDSRSGRDVWHHPGVFNAPLALADTLLLAPRADGVLLALDVRSGRQLWQTEIGGRLWAGVCAAAGWAYIGGTKGELTAVDLTTGAVQRRARLEGGAVRTRPLFAGGLVYAGTAGGGITALDAGTGAQRWSAALGAMPASGLACADTVLVTGAADGCLYGLHRESGRILWRCSTDGVIRSAPAVTRKTAYCGSMDGHLYAVELASGRVLARFQLDGSSAAPVALGAGLVFIVSERGTAYAFKPN